MKTRMMILAIPLFGLLTAPALAHKDHDGSRAQHRFEQRIDRQNQRIRHGIRNGELTRHEAKRLRREQRRIARMEHRFSDDGYLDRHERRKLHRRLNKASDRIYRLKHNERYRTRVHAQHDGDKKHHRYDRHYRGYDHGRDIRYDGGWAMVLHLSDHF